MSINTSDILSKDTNPKTLTFDIKVNVAHNKLYPDRDSPVDESLHREVLVVGQGSKDRPWYADIVNNFAADLEPGVSCPRFWIGSSGWTAVRGNAPVWSYDPKTSGS